MTRINERIRAPKIRVVYQDKNVVMMTKEALKLAEKLGLDLVEIASNADPPVCKIVDYGKYKYEQAKQSKDNVKHRVKTKEIKFRVGIEKHDYEMKLGRAETFLSHGDKLRFQLQFRGRENAHRELGFELMDRVKRDLAGMAKVDSDARLSGRQIHMMMSPLSKDQQVPKFSHHHQEYEGLEDDEHEYHDDDDDDHDDHEKEDSSAKAGKSES